MRYIANQQLYCRVSNFFNLSQDDRKEVLTKNNVFKEEFTKILQKIDTDGWIYAKINNGFRAGTITKLYGKLEDFTGSKKYSELIDGTYLYGYYYDTIWLSARYPIITFDSMDFKGKKVKCFDNMNQDLELLLDYTGEPVYQTENKQHKKENLYCRNMFDRMNEKVELGDLFFLSNQDRIIIGKLTKVYDSGVIKYRDFDTNKEIMLRKDNICFSLRNGRAISSILKYSKDLGQKLMIAKLSK